MWNGVRNMTFGNFSRRWSVFPMSSWSGVIPAAIGGVIGLIWGLVLAFACVGLPGVWRHLVFGFYPGARVGSDDAFRLGALVAYQGWWTAIIARRRQNKRSAKIDGVRLWL